MDEKIFRDRITDENFIMDASKNLFFMGEFVVDLKDDTISFSEEFIDYFHLNRSDLDSAAHNLMDEFVEFAENRGFDDVIASIIERGVEISYEAKVNRRDGSIVWILVNGDYHEDSKEIYGKIIDITSYKKTLEMARGNIDFLESLFELIPYPVFYQDMSDNMIRANKRLDDFLGNYDHAKEDHETLGDGDVLKGQLFNLDDDLLLTNGSQAVERILRFKDGTFHNVIINRSLMRDHKGEMDGVLGIVIDITEKTQLEERLKTHNMVKDILMNISNKLMDYNDENELFQEVLEQYIKISKTTDFGTVLKIEGDTFVPVASVGYIKSAIDTFRLPVDDSFVYKHSGGIINRPGIIPDVKVYHNEVDFVPLEEAKQMQSILYIPLFSEGILQWVISFDSSKQFYFNEDDLITAEIIKGQIELIIRMFNIYNQAKLFSRYDSLTNLMNRRYFEAVFDERLKLAKRNKTSVLLVHFDLDDLKGVNDQFGHMLGDDYIRLFTELLTGHFRAADTFGRIGGDEFVGLFYNADFDSLHEKMVLLRALFQSKCIPIEDYAEICGAFSFGISAYPNDGNSIDDLMKVADERMYLFKHKNKRRIQLYNV